MYLNLFIICSLDAAKYVGSAHYQVNSNLTAAAQLNWTSGANTSSLTVCGKYTVDEDTFMKVRAILIDNLCFDFRFLCMGLVVYIKFLSLG